MRQDYEVQQRVEQPAAQIAALCVAPARLIQKRHHKKLDYDVNMARHHEIKETHDSLEAKDVSNTASVSHVSKFGHENWNVQL